MVSPVQPVAPAHPVQPDKPIPAKNQAYRSGAQLGGAGGIMAILYYFGLDGELAVFIGWLYALIMGGVARYNRDRMRATPEAERTPWMYILERLAPLLVVAILCSGCANALKLGPGPYGWVLWQYSIADDANFEATVLGNEVKLGEPGQQASKPGVGEGQ